MSTDLIFGDIYSAGSPTTLVFGGSGSGVTNLYSRAVAVAAAQGQLSYTDTLLGADALAQSTGGAALYLLSPLSAGAAAQSALSADLRVRHDIYLAADAAASASCPNVISIAKQLATTPRAVAAAQGGDILLGVPCAAAAQSASAAAAELSLVSAVGAPVYASPTAVATASADMLLVVLSPPLGVVCSAVAASTGALATGKGLAAATSAQASAASDIISARAVQATLIAAAIASADLYVTRALASAAAATASVNSVLALAKPLAGIAPAAALTTGSLKAWVGYYPAPWRTVFIGEDDRSYGVTQEVRAFEPAD